MSRDVPEGWSLKRLDDVMVFQNGFAFKPADWGSSGRPIVRIQNLNGGGDFNFYDGYVPPQFGIKSGDILFCWSGSRGTSFGPRRWRGGEGWLNQHIFRCDLKSGIDGDFAFYLLEHLTEAIEQAAHGGAGLVHIKKSELVKFEAAMPPLHEQRRIAEILSSVDDAIAATRAVIEQTRKVKQGVLEDLLTKGMGHTRFKQTDIGEIPEVWDVAPIEAYLARLIDYRGVPPPKADAGVPLITAKNVRFGYLNPEPREYIRDDDFDSWMRRGLPEADDVLFTTEAPLGNVAQVPKYKIALGQRTITLCPDRIRLLPSFLKWLLLSPQSQTRIAEKATGSTALGIKQSTFRKMLFPFPPLDEQRRIASSIDEIAVAEDAELKKLEAVFSTKSALMSDLLTGRKRITDNLPIAAE